MRGLFLLFFLIIFAACKPVAAQVSMKDSVVGLSMITVSGNYSICAGDMSDRFGNNFSVGCGFQRKTKKDWIWAFEGSFIFGGKVKEDSILKNLTTSQGYIIAGDGSYADVQLHERGYSILFKVGKIFPGIGPNKNSGITATLGAGFLEHRISIEDKDNVVAALSSEYKKGYDRLCNGFCLTQFIGYSNFSNSRRINFFAGFEAMQGFTKNRRTINYDTMQTDTSNRLDLFFGIRLGWIIPLFKKLPKEYYYD
jgi:hypothetical protein